MSQLSILSLGSIFLVLSSACSPSGETFCFTPGCEDPDPPGPEGSTDESYVTFSGGDMPIAQGGIDLFTAEDAANVPVTVKSSDVSVATVRALGDGQFEVTGLAPGSTTLTASSQYDTQTLAADVLPAAAVRLGVPLGYVMPDNVQTHTFTNDNVYVPLSLHAADGTQLADLSLTLTNGPADAVLTEAMWLRLPTVVGEHLVTVHGGSGDFDTPVTIVDHVDRIEATEDVMGGERRVCFNAWVGAELVMTTVWPVENRAPETLTLARVASNCVTVQGEGDLQVATAGAELVVSVTDASPAR